MYSIIISCMKQYKRVLRGVKLASLEFITRLKSRVLNLSFLLKVFCWGDDKFCVQKNTQRAAW